MKNKYIFLGDINSINVELIVKSFRFLKNKVNYIIICDAKKFSDYQKKIKSNIKLNLINNPFDFKELLSNFINIFNVSPKFNRTESMLNELYISNKLCNLTGYDLVTMPINKFSFKRTMKFNGMTEYLGEINQRKTIMLMVGEKFSIIPITTHINLKSVGKGFKKKLQQFIKNFNKIEFGKNLFEKYKEFRFLCFNPHCGENRTLGLEDYFIKKEIKKINKGNIITIAADSAFRKTSKKYLFFSFYHDQALIPFKILNKKSYNQTIGLSYRRLSPSHGTAVDIKFKNKADNTSYLQCMLN